jgi:hypothetical protein
MTATAPAAPQPTDEQLKDYADKLPELYKDILAALQYAQPDRVAGQGVLDGTVRNFLKNKAEEVRRRSALGPMYISPDRVGLLLGKSSYLFGTAILEVTDPAFDAAIDRLAEAGFLEFPDDPRLGSLIPTPLGERLIAAITGKTTPRQDIPDLPKPTW